MTFNQKDWESKASKAKTQAEFTALIMELPDSTGNSDQKCSVGGRQKPETPLVLDTKIGKIPVG